MGEVTRIDRHKEAVTNRGQSNRFLKIADELEADIEKMRKIQLTCIPHDMNDNHLEAQIQIFTDTMNEYREDAVKLRRM